MAKVVQHQGDLEKLQDALGEVFQIFSSVENVLEAFGLADMPVAQRYGILFGCLVFVGTVVSVLTLLIMGGSFRRMAEQAQSGSTSVPTGYQTLRSRALLLERLLDARERLLAENYPDREVREENVTTNLTKMMLSVSPRLSSSSISKLVHEGDRSRPRHDGAKDEQWLNYQENYSIAYRKCQDKPGGAILAGRPEARYEAYARAYAGCGNVTRLSYRRSYAKLYEAICCADHKSDDKYVEIFDKTPEAIVGKAVRLEGLDVDKHLTSVFDATCGNAYNEIKSFDPDQVWGFQMEGPFERPSEMKKSFVFARYKNEAAFCIRQNISDRVIGAVLLSNDRPDNLSIQIHPPIVNPSFLGGRDQMEACFLLLDRLFAHGYRRVFISIDSKDSDGSKLADRLGFTFEGCLLKDMIVKESSRDSNIYGMLNSDWDKGARTSLYKKLYGAAAAKADLAFIKKEDELDEQQRVLAEQRAQEATR